MHSADTAGSTSQAWVAGSDAPERAQLRIGFMRLTDCAPLVMAAELGFDRKHGVEFVLRRETSWAGVRDKLVAGELDMAQALYGLVYGVHLGIGGPKWDMAVLMTLNRNGQGLTLSKALASQGVVDLATLARHIGTHPGVLRLAQTFPTGTHAMWLYYWLAAGGVDPLRDVKIATVPPAQMVPHLRGGHIDGCSVGEPWNQCAIFDGVGVSAAASQDIWKDHPEKVLGCSAAFVDAHPNSARAAVMAVLEASRWIDANVHNKVRMATTLARTDYVNSSVDTLLPRLLGHCPDGQGRMRHDVDAVKFFDDGTVNFPYLSDGMWFMTQYRRWGLLDAHPDYLRVARHINRIELYRQAAAALGIQAPTEPMRASRLIDGITWDGSDPARYADCFTVRAPVRSLQVA